MYRYANAVFMGVQVNGGGTNMQSGNENNPMLPTYSSPVERLRVDGCSLNLILFQSACL